MAVRSVFASEDMLSLIEVNTDDAAAFGVVYNLCRNAGLSMPGNPMRSRSPHFERCR